jgi:hypothetical protein
MNVSGLKLVFLRGSQTYLCGIRTTNEVSLYKLINGRRSIQRSGIFIELYFMTVPFRFASTGLIQMCISAEMCNMLSCLLLIH